LIFVAVFKTLKYEKNNVIYNERQLLKRYLEIKKINPDYRILQLREWELSVVDAVENSNIKSTSKIIQFHPFNKSK